MPMIWAAEMMQVDLLEAQVEECLAEWAA